MFGYASDETPECMPLTLQLAHQMNKKIADLRRDGTLWWARPDSKTQVTAEYMFEGGAWSQYPPLPCNRHNIHP